MCIRDRALGVGVSSIRSDSKAGGDSFGLVALSSVGPILAVLVLGLCFPGEGSYEPIALPEVDWSNQLARIFVAALPHYAKEVGIALAPIVVFFLLFHFLCLHLERRPFVKILVGLGYTYVGPVSYTHLPVPGQAHGPGHALAVPAGLRRHGAQIHLAARGGVEQQPLRPAVSLGPENLRADGGVRRLPRRGLHRPAGRQPGLPLGLLLGPDAGLLLRIHAATPFRIVSPILADFRKKTRGCRRRADN